MEAATTARLFQVRLVDLLNNTIASSSLLKHVLGTYTIRKCETMQ